MTGRGDDPDTCDRCGAPGRVYVSHGACCGFDGLCDACLDVTHRARGRRRDGDQRFWINDSPELEGWEGLPFGAATWAIVDEVQGGNILYCHQDTAPGILAALVTQEALDGQPMRAGDVKPHDVVVGGGTVLWVMSPLRPGVSPLLPKGGALITFEDRRQIGVPVDLQLTVQRPEPLRALLDVLGELDSTDATQIEPVTDNVKPCSARDSRGVGCVYREGHDPVFHHRYE